MLTTKVLVDSGTGIPSRSHHELTKNKFGENSSSPHGRRQNGARYERS